MRPVVFNSLFWIILVISAIVWANEGFVIGVGTFVTLIVILVVSDILWEKNEPGEWV